MHVKGKGKTTSHKTNKQSLFTPFEPVDDIYDFDQQDVSSSAQVHSAGRVPEFCSPKLSKNSVKSKQLCSSKVAVAVTHSGKTSTPCAATGTTKAKKKTPDITAPWVVLSHVQASSLEAYAVSPIAVEHNSPNDLSRQVDVNSMFDDASCVMDDSALFVTKGKCSKTESKWNNKMAAATVTAPAVKDSAVTNCATEDGKDAGTGQDISSKKHEAEIDSGYPRLDSQCDFVSLSAGDNFGVAEDQSSLIPGLQCMKGHAEYQNVHVDKQMYIEDINSGSELISDSDCEMIATKAGVLDQKKFNSSVGRCVREIKAKRFHQSYEDVEPSDSGNNSDSDTSSEKIPKISSSRKESKVKSETGRGKPVPSKRTCVLRTRNNILDSASDSTDDAQSRKRPVKRKRKTELAEVQCDKSSRLMKPVKTAELDNPVKPEKSKSCQRRSKKQIAESESKKLKESLITRMKGDAGGDDAADGDAECITAENFLSSLDNRKKQKGKPRRRKITSSSLLSEEYMEHMRELDDIADNYSLIIE